MKHVFVETNWLVEIVGPPHKQKKSAVELLARAQAGDIELLIPSVCIQEARNVLNGKVKKGVRGVAREFNEFLKWARINGAVREELISAGFSLVSVFESRVANYIEKDAEKSLEAIRFTPGVKVFPLDEQIISRMLEISVSPFFNLQPMDQAVFASVLAAGKKLYSVSGQTSLFCEMDSDLQPWDKNGDKRPSFFNSYHDAGVRVIEDFVIQDQDED